jgi:photosystem II stability/assembly factor-like uncharacterized protein
MSLRSLTRKILLLGLISLLIVRRAGKVSAGNNVWTSIGPEGVYIMDLAIDPQNTNTIYAGQDGVYKSTDGGEHWVSIGPSYVTIYALAIDPQNTDTIYAGSYYSGLYKTIDGGDNWNKISSNTGLTDTTIPDLEIDPQQTNLVYAATWNAGMFVIDFIDSTVKIYLPLVVRQ